jgi:hypothetical protein
MDFIVNIYQTVFQNICMELLDEEEFNHRILNHKEFLNDPLRLVRPLSKYDII